MLVLGADDAGAIELLEGAAMELAGAAAGAVADAVWLAGAGLLAGVAAAEAPESISDFLLLRVFLVPVSVAVAEVSVVAAVLSVDAAFLVFFVFVAGVAVVSAAAAD